MGKHIPHRRGIRGRMTLAESVRKTLSRGMPAILPGTFWIL